MKKIAWKQHHKWFGLLFTVFLLLFCISGVLLNHRNMISDMDISRKYLPEHFQYKKWNNGALKGSIKVPMDSVIYIYGNAGVFRSNIAGTAIESFNNGFPKGVDRRNIQSMCLLEDGKIYALSQFSLYELKDNRWTEVFLSANERLVDLFIDNGKLTIMGRSNLYKEDESNFKKYALKAPINYNNRVTLFRTVWLIHSGELFGVLGKLFVDLVAVILMILSVTGILYWILPKYIRKQKQRGLEVIRGIGLLKGTLNWHDKVGRITIVFTLFITITGWCLRPPLLILLASAKVPPIPGTIVDSNNPWHDKLRAITYDKASEEWLISTSEGFYTLTDLESVPVLVEKSPPVSVMGINVMHQREDGVWLIGSFSGMYKWDRKNSLIQDYFTGEVAITKAGPPFGKRAIAGFSNDFKDNPILVEYYDGTNVLKMPNEYSELPMSLWNLALEVHTGRIYTILGNGTLVYITFAGLIVIWILATGYVVRKRKNHQ